jgi:hypothetical protein
MSMLDCIQGRAFPFAALFKSDDFVVRLLFSPFSSLSLPFFFSPLHLSTSSSLFLSLFLSLTLSYPLTPLLFLGL